MAFDPSTSSLILFGGFDSGLLGDTWAWDGKSWHVLSPNSSPGPTDSATIAYSAATRKLILFGGADTMMAAGGSNQTWAWDGMNWSEISFGAPPPARDSAAMTADSEGKVILLFGGYGDSTLGDTWTLTRTWSQDTQTLAPSPRLNASLAPDRSGSLLLFGGEGGNGGLMGDTWAWKPF
jgi:hypothetical protein